MISSLTLVAYAAFCSNPFASELLLIPERAAACHIYRFFPQPARLLQARWETSLHDADDDA